MKHLKRSESGYLLLVLLTGVLCIWQLLGMDRQLQLYPEPSRSAYTYNDSINGGRSIGKLSHSTEGLSLDCKTRSSHTFAFCGMVIPTGESATHGLDLGGYDELHLWLDHQSQHKDTLLIYLQNHQSAKSGAKQKEVSLYPVMPEAGMTHYTLPLERFFVPSWWLLAFGDEQQDAQPMLNNVTGIQLASGDSTQERQLSFTVQRVELRGKWISAQTLYGLLLVLWISVIVLHGIVRFVALNRSVVQSQHRQLELEKLNQLLCIEKDQFESMAKTDPLTGINNRAGLRQALNTMQQAYTRDNQPCCAILFDIDRFKAINDTHGHDVGDQVLQILASTVSGQIREGDCLGRWGGEEFVVLCPGSTQKQAEQLAEKLRLVLSQVAHIGLPAFTCSFGVAEYHGEEFDAWFKAADQALYQAKAQGRNQVRAA